MDPMKGNVKNRTWLRISLKYCYQIISMQQGEFKDSISINVNKFYIIYSNS